jgi:2-polyprenyl-6-hydroxyphenyl methylase / 3-demethylubiquinone-9 3-methyltransferase
MIENEIKKFTSIASSWWDKNGPFKMLHNITPIRLKYILGQISANNLEIEKLKILDVGCGGGLLSIPLANLGANVLGIDLGLENIIEAQKRAKKEDINVNFETKSLEDLITESMKFDVVICSEVIEHVENAEEFISKLSKAVKKDGIIVLSTMNRTNKSKYLGIYFAEYIANLLPKGTHDWDKFVTPREIQKFSRASQLEIIDAKGIIFDIISRGWILGDNLDMNYLITLKKS